MMASVAQGEADVPDGDPVAENTHDADDHFPVVVLHVNGAAAGDDVRLFLGHDRRLGVLESGVAR